MLEARYLTPAGLTPGATRRLLHWLLERGADEFTVAVMALGGEPARVADAFEDALAPFELPIARRRVASAAADAAPSRSVRRWAFTAESLPELLAFLPAGLFDAQPGPSGWLEDLAIYAQGELLLGVVTHEREAVLRLTPAEHREVEALGVSSSGAGESIDY